MYPHLMALKAEREFILVGDVNIAHQEIDLKNWRSNQKNSGFLPEERAWMTKLLTDGGLVDVYRQLEPDATDACYTWWSNRGQAWAKNVGWRLDYHLATPALAAKAKTVSDLHRRRSSATTRRWSARPVPVPAKAAATLPQAMPLRCGSASVVVQP
jgi:exodeoxyribonuclease III